MDISVNKPAKDFLKRTFEEWYADRVMNQLQGVTDIESAEIQPINLCFAEIRVLSAKWLVEMEHYLAENPQFIVNGFRCAGILAALDGCEDDDDLSEADSEDSLSDNELTD